MNVPQRVNSDRRHEAGDGLIHHVDRGSSALLYLPHIVQSVLTASLFALADIVSESGCYHTGRSRARMLSSRASTSPCPPSSCVRTSMKILRVQIIGSWFRHCFTLLPSIHTWRPNGAVEFRPSEPMRPVKNKQSAKALFDIVDSWSVSTEPVYARDDVSQAPHANFQSFV